jgi:hypothetical protein
MFAVSGHQQSRGQACLSGVVGNHLVECLWRD